MYRTLIKQNPKYASLIGEVSALSEMRKELEQKINQLPDKEITRHEIKRDLGVTGPGLNLALINQILEERKSKRRKAKFNAKEAILYRLNFPGHAELKGVRIGGRKCRGPELLKKLAKENLKE